MNSMHFMPSQISLFPFRFRITGVLFGVFFLFGFFGSSRISAAPGFLHRDGRWLSDSAGNHISLRGVNLGGWLLWEGWMWGDGFKSQTRLLRRFNALVGPEETARFRKAVFQEAISEADIRRIAEAGFNVVRIPFNHRIFDFSGDSVSAQSPGWAILDTVTSWCRKYGIYSVIDMHAAPGGQSIFFIADHTRHELLWHSEASRRKTIALWKAIAKHFAGNTGVAGYDLLNEPVPPADRKLLRLYERIIASIRGVDTHHVLFLEGAKFAKRFTAFRSLPDSNMAFSFHIYNWFGGEPGTQVKAYARLGKELNAPVWCGEWGENTYEVVSHTRDVMEDPDNGFSGWCYWSWKRVHLRFPTLNEVQPGDKWKKIMGWFKYPDDANKPTREETLTAMKEFLEAVKFANLQTDKRMFDILSVKREK